MSHWTMKAFATIHRHMTVKGRMVLHRLAVLDALDTSNARLSSR